MSKQLFLQMGIPENPIVRQVSASSAHGLFRFRREDARDCLAFDRGQARHVDRQTLEPEQDAALGRA